jgi:hypothetical protein
MDTPHEVTIGSTDTVHECCSCRDGRASKGVELRGTFLTLKGSGDSGAKGRQTRSLETSLDSLTP